MLQYRLLVNHKQADTWERQVNYYRPILQDYHAVTQQLSDKKSEQEQLQTNRNAVPCCKSPSAASLPSKSPH